MKILVMPVGSSGDVHPLLGVALKLKERGHDILFITNGHFGPLARSAGLNFEELSSDAEYREAINDPDIWHPVRGTKKVLEWGMIGLLRKSYEIVAKHYVPGETIVVAAALGLGPRVAHDKLGVPLATVQLQPMALYSKVQPSRFPGMPAWAPPWMIRMMLWIGDRAVVNPIVLPPLNQFRKELGLPPVTGNFFSDYINSPQLTLGLFPEWFAPPPPDWPKQLRLCGFPLYDEKGVTALDPALEEFLNSGTPPIVFTPGSAMLQGLPFFSAAAEACRLIGRRGLLLTRFPENIPAKLPDGVRHFAYAPFSQVLPRCAALVHHGGIGTMAQALAAGIPQLIMPMAHDQFDNASRVEKLGVGLSIKRSNFLPRPVAERLRKLLEDPVIGARAKEIAKRFEGARSIDEACDHVEALAKSAKARTPAHA